MRYRRWGAIAAAVLVAGLSSTVVPAVSMAAPAAGLAVGSAPAGSTYTPIVPIRLADTRNTGEIAAHGDLILSLRGDMVPGDATAVVLNLTGLDATDATYLTVYPAGDNFPPSSSNLNIAAGDIRANLVTVPFTSASQSELVVAGPSAVDAVVDLDGYYSPSTGSGFTSLAPQRVLDTRDGTGIGGAAGKIQAGQTVTLDLSSQLPAGATAAVFNLTAVDPTEDSFVTAWPADAGSRPLASNVNFAPGQITPNLVIVGVSPDRKVNLYNNSGQVDLIADLAGYYSAQSTQVFYPVTPIRVLDTRDVDGNSRVPLLDHGTRQVGLGGWLPANASSAVLNLTGTNVTAPSTFVTAWPDGRPLPTASNLNLVAGQTAANLSIVATGSNEAIDLYNLNGSVDAIVDLFGYFAPRLTACTADCVFAMGTNRYGRLGNGTTSDFPQSPGPVGGLSGVVTVAGGFGNGYALRSDGTVWAWGQNGSGQLGNGMSGTAMVPPFLGYDGVPYNSTVPVQVRGLSDVTEISDAFALRSDGTVWSWGGNGMWRLGDGDTDEKVDASTPVQVTGLTGIVDITGNLSNGYALKSDGTVWSWGRNVEGELGNGTGGTATICTVSNQVSPDGPNCASAVPVQVSGLTGVTKIGVGMAVTSDGTVWRWGPHGSRQDDVPVPVPGLTNVTAFAQTDSDPATYYALRSDGTIWAWGDNSYYGSFGNGTTCTYADKDACYSVNPVQVSGLTDVTAISAGAGAGYALRSDGTVWAWGSSQDGELGNGMVIISSDRPVSIQGLSGVSTIGSYGYSVVPNP